MILLRWNLLVIGTAVAMNEFQVNCHGRLRPEGEEAQVGVGSSNSNSGSNNRDNKEQPDGSGLFPNTDNKDYRYVLTNTVPKRTRQASSKRQLQKKRRQKRELDLFSAYGKKQETPGDGYHDDDTNVSPSAGSIIMVNGQPTNKPPTRPTPKPVRITSRQPSKLNRKPPVFPPSVFHMGRPESEKSPVVDDSNAPFLPAPPPSPAAPPTAPRAPAPRAPATRAPATRAPATRAPATRAPAIRAPATRAPATRAPAPASRPDNVSPHPAARRTKVPTWNPSFTAPPTRSNMPSPQNNTRAPENKEFNSVNGVNGINNNSVGHSNNEDEYDHTFLLASMWIAIVLCIMVLCSLVYCYCWPAYAVKKAHEKRSSDKKPGKKTRNSADDSNSILTEDDTMILESTGVDVAVKRGDETGGEYRALTSMPDPDHPREFDRRPKLRTSAQGRHAFSTPKIQRSRKPPTTPRDSTIPKDYLTIQSDDDDFLGIDYMCDALSPPAIQRARQPPPHIMTPTKRSPSRPKNEQEEGGVEVLESEYLSSFDMASLSQKSDETKSKSKSKDGGEQASGSNPGVVKLVFSPERSMDDSSGYDDIVDEEGNAISMSTARNSNGPVFRRFSGEDHEQSRGRFILTTNGSHDGGRNQSGITNSDDDIDGDSSKYNNRENERISEEEKKEEEKREVSEEENGSTTNPRVNGVPIFRSFSGSGEQKQSRIRIYKSTDKSDTSKSGESEDQGNAGSRSTATASTTRSTIFYMGADDSPQRPRRRVWNTSSLLDSASAASVSRGSSGDDVPDAAYYASDDDSSALFTENEGQKGSDESKSSESESRKSTEAATAIRQQHQQQQQRQERLLPLEEQRRVLDTATLLTMPVPKQQPIDDNGHNDTGNFAPVLRSRSFESYGRYRDTLMASLHNSDIAIRSRSWESMSCDGVGAGNLFCRNIYSDIDSDSDDIFTGEEDNHQSKEARRPPITIPRREASSSSDKRSNHAAKQQSGTAHKRSRRWQNEKGDYENLPPTAMEL